ncbi:hypothetical protein BC830DRAFT_1134695 [Chytriomyces sp. MP71]|nr:hypothetical protein BC830DRAFT_1134695 [Chytriomyces sp. MP71]
MASPTDELTVDALARRILWLQQHMLSLQETVSVLRARRERRVAEKGANQESALPETASIPTPASSTLMSFSFSSPSVLSNAKSVRPPVAESTSKSATFRTAPPSRSESRIGQRTVSGIPNDVADDMLGVSSRDVAHITEKGASTVARPSSSLPALTTPMDSNARFSQVRIAETMTERSNPALSMADTLIEQTGSLPPAPANASTFAPAGTDRYLTESRASRAISYEIKERVGSRLSSSSSTAASTPPYAEVRGLQADSPAKYTSTTMIPAQSGWPSSSLSVTSTSRQSTDLALPRVLTDYETRTSDERPSSRASFLLSKSLLPALLPMSNQQSTTSGRESCSALSSIGVILDGPPLVEQNAVGQPQKFQTVISPVDTWKKPYQNDSCDSSAGSSGSPSRQDSFPVTSKITTNLTRSPSAQSPSRQSSSRAMSPTDAWSRPDRNESHMSSSNSVRSPQYKAEGSSSYTATAGMKRARSQSPPPKRGWNPCPQYQMGHCRKEESHCPMDHRCLACRQPHFFIDCEAFDRNLCSFFNTRHGCSKRPGMRPCSRIHRCAKCGLDHPSCNCPSLCQ